MNVKVCLAYDLINRCHVTINTDPGFCPDLILGMMGIHVRAEPDKVAFFSVITETLKK